MARKSHEDALGVAGAETIIGTGVKLKGNLRTESDLVIDGRLDGDILAEGNVTIGVNAHVLGNISGSNITIAGEVDGNVISSGEACLLATAQVKGDVKTSSFVIASGAVFNGRSQMEIPGAVPPHTNLADETASPASSSE